ncbi:MAG: hypothetical protein ACYC6N_31355 [Pirellulaceae bacterium]
MTDPEFKADEEQRRERNWDPAERWRVLQETLSWAEAQATVRRNTKQSQLARQSEKVARLGSGEEE